MQMIKNDWHLLYKQIPRPSLLRLCITWPSLLHIAGFMHIAYLREDSFMSRNYFRLCRPSCVRVYQSSGTWRFLRLSSRLSMLYAKLSRDKQNLDEDWNSLPKFYLIFCSNVNIDCFSRSARFRTWKSEWFFSLEFVYQILFNKVEVGWRSSCHVKYRY